MRDNPEADKLPSRQAVMKAGCPSTSWCGKRRLRNIMSVMVSGASFQLADPRGVSFQLADPRGVSFQLAEEMFSL